LKISLRILLKLYIPAIKANAIYEDRYLLGTSIARPVIAKRQVETQGLKELTLYATVQHVKGMDQVKFEMAFKGLAPDLRSSRRGESGNLTPAPNSLITRKSTASLSPITKDNLQYGQKHSPHILRSGIWKTPQGA
jgi:argininosuccinate synthase